MMRNNLLIILILIFFSCNNEKEHDLYINQISEFKESSIIYEIVTKKTIKRIEKKLQDMLRSDPVRIKPWYDKAIEIKTISDSLIQSIEMIEKRFIGGVEIENNLKEYKSLPKKDVKLIKDMLEKFVPMLDTVLNMNPKNIEHLSSGSKRILVLDSIPLSSNYQRIYKTHAVLLYIMNLIQSIRSDYLSKIVSYIDYGGHQMFDWRVVVIPESQIIRKGGIFEADIFLCAGIDTIHNFPIYIDEREVVTKKKNNYQYFRVKATGSPRVVKKDGYILVANPVTGDSTKYPFRIEYEIIK